MSEHIREHAGLRLDVAYGPQPNRPEPLAALRWSDLRRRARPRAAAPSDWRPHAAKHARWGDGIARLRGA